MKTLALSWLSVLALVCFLAPISQAFPLNGTPDEKRQFVDFVSRFDKKYNSGEEVQQRFSIFQNNLKLANEMNLMSQSDTYGVTKFSDLTQEEFENMYLMKNFKPHRVDAPVVELDLPNDFTLPVSFDWRSKNAVTPVYNQGQCGSCWAFSATEAIESQWFLSKGTLIQLSMQQIVDCDLGNGDEGCNGGDTPTAYAYVIKAGGLENGTVYPYTAEDDSCAFNPNDIQAKISSWNYATKDKDEVQMQEVLVAKGPLSICVDATTWQFYVGGVISSFCGDELDHCVMITGFQNYTSMFGTYPVWNVRNSWGSDWGDGGYLYVERGNDLCGIADEVTLPVV